MQHAQTSIGFSKFEQVVLSVFKGENGEPGQYAFEDYDVSIGGEFVFEDETVQFVGVRKDGVSVGSCLLDEMDR